MKCAVRCVSALFALLVSPMLYAGPIPDPNQAPPCDEERAESNNVEWVTYAYKYLVADNFGPLPSGCTRAPLANSFLQTVYVVRPASRTVEPYTTCWNVDVDQVKCIAGPDSPDVRVTRVWSASGQIQLSFDAADRMKQEALVNCLSRQGTSTGTLTLTTSTAYAPTPSSVSRTITCVSTNRN